MSNKSEQALAVIETYLADLTEGNAHEVVHALRARFGWQGSVMTTEDIEYRISAYCPDLSDDKVEELVSATVATRTWNRYVCDEMIEAGWEALERSLWEAAGELGIEL